MRVLVRRLRNSYHRADLHTKLQSHALWISLERPWGTKFNGTCRVCKGQRNHPTSECPSRWQKKGITLPGFNTSDGTRDGRAWSKSGKEPIRATIQSWIDFINNPSNWNGRTPVPAGVAGGLSVTDFENRLPAAPVKP